VLRPATERDDLDGRPHPLVRFVCTRAVGRGGRARAGLGIVVVAALAVAAVPGVLGAFLAPFVVAGAIAETTFGRAGGLDRDAYSTLVSAIVTLAYVVAVATVAVVAARTGRARLRGRSARSGK
jgi:hypothetical protein